jgi:hypothetical protein
MGWLITVLGILVVILGLFFLLVYLMRQRIDTGVQELQTRFPNTRQVWRKAQSFGQESRGKTQLRGNGILLLTDQELFFQGILPKREFTIPLQQIQSVEIVKSHLGKSTFRNLVKVNFTNDAGQAYSIAWDMENSHEAKQMIDSALTR